MTDTQLEVCVMADIEKTIQFIGLDDFTAKIYRAGAAASIGKGLYFLRKQKILKEKIINNVRTFRFSQFTI